MIISCVCHRGSSGSAMVLANGERALLGVIMVGRGRGLGDDKLKGGNGAGAVRSVNPANRSQNLPDMRAPIERECWRATCPHV